MTDSYEAGSEMQLLLPPPIACHLDSRKVVIPVTTAFSSRIRPLWKLRRKKSVVCKIHFSWCLISYSKRSKPANEPLSFKDFRIPSLNVIEIFGSELEPDFATFKLNDQATAIDLSKSYWDRSRNLTHIEGVVLVDLQHSLHDVFTWEQKRCIRFVISYYCHFPLYISLLILSTYEVTLWVKSYVPEIRIGDKVSFSWSSAI